MEWRRRDSTGAQPQVKGTRQGGETGENIMHDNEQEADRDSEHAGEPIVTVGNVPCRVDIGMLVVSGPTMDVLRGQQSTAIAESAMQSQDVGTSSRATCRTGQDASRAKGPRGAAIEECRITRPGERGAITFRTG
jgi:hypothetical protein